jgi:hypothetical protein
VSPAPCPRSLLLPGAVAFAPRWAPVVPLPWRRSACGCNHGSGDSRRPTAGASARDSRPAPAPARHEKGQRRGRRRAARFAWSAASGLWTGADARRRHPPPPSAFAAHPPKQRGVDCREALQRPVERASSLVLSVVSQDGDAGLQRGISGIWDSYACCGVHKQGDGTGAPGPSPCKVAQLDRITGGLNHGDGCCSPRGSGRQVLPLADHNRGVARSLTAHGQPWESRLPCRPRSLTD